MIENDFQFLLKQRGINTKYRFYRLFDFFGYERIRQECNRTG